MKNSRFYRDEFLLWYRVQVSNPGDPLFYRDHLITFLFSENFASTGLASIISYPLLMHLQWTAALYQLGLTYQHQGGSFLYTGFSHPTLSISVPGSCVLASRLLICYGLTTFHSPVIPLSWFDLDVWKWFISLTSPPFLYFFLPLPLGCGDR